MWGRNNDKKEAPFALIFMDGVGRKKCLIKGYRCYDNAGMDMGRIRSGMNAFTGDGQQSSIELTQGVRENELRVEDVNEVVIFKLEKVTSL